VRLLLNLCHAFEEPSQQGGALSGAALLDYLYDGEPSPCSRRRCLQKRRALRPRAYFGATRWPAPPAARPLLPPQRRPLPGPAAELAKADAQAYPVVRFLLALALRPYLAQLQEWMYSPEDSSRAAAEAADAPPCPRFLQHVREQLHSAGQQLRQLHQLAPHIGALAQRLGAQARAAQQLGAAPAAAQQAKQAGPAAAAGGWQVLLVEPPEAGLAALQQDLLLGTSCQALEAALQRQQQAQGAMAREVDWVLERLAAKRQAEERVQELQALAVLHDRCVPGPGVRPSAVRLPCCRGPLDAAAPAAAANRGAPPAAPARAGRPCARRRWRCSGSSARSGAGSSSSSWQSSRRTWRSAAPRRGSWRWSSAARSGSC
jgi:hypothetical protein